MPGQTASSPWGQSDWSGGIGTNTSTQYSASADIDTSTPGEFSLSAPSDWFDADWEYRQCATIDNSTNTNTHTEYQVLLTGFDSAALVTDGKLDSDCADLRFATTSGGSSLDYSIIGTSCNTADTRIWVQVDSIPASGSSTLCAYYGNSGAPAVESLENTFTYSSTQVVGIVAHAALAADGLSVISLADGNEITNGGTTLNLDDQDTGALTASVGTEISATKLFNADSNAETTDMLTPISFAGTEFIHYSNRSDHFYEIYSHWGDANVTVFLDGVSFATPTVSEGTSTIVNTGNYNDRNVRITSDMPVHVHHRASTSDSVVLYPATSEDLFGIPSTLLNIAAGPSGASTSWIFSDGTTTGSPQALAANGIYEQSGFGSQGNSKAIRISSDEVFGASQVADSDGGESTIFWPQQEMGTKFGAAETLEYITVAAPEASTTCTVTNSVGGTPTNDSAGTNPDTGGVSTEVNFLYFLFNTPLAAGWKMECNKPVYAYYESDAPSDEHNTWSYPQMRQYSYPEPALGIFGSEENNIEDTGSLTSAIFDTDDESTWGEGSFTVSGSGSTTVKVRTSDNSAMTGAPAFGTCGAISSGSDLSGNNCVTDGDRYVQYQVTLDEGAGGSPVFEDISIAFANIIPPEPLKADAGPDRVVVAGRSETLDGSASTGEGITFAWDIIDGPGDLDDITSETPLYSAPSDAIGQQITVVLTVTDENGDRDTDEMMITIIPLVQGSDSATDISGVVDGTILTEARVVDEEGRERIQLETDDADILLPAGAVSFALAQGDTGRLVIGIGSLDDGAGRLYISRVPIADLAGTIDLEASNQPNLVTALTVTNGEDFMVVSGRQAGDALGDFVTVQTIGDSENYLISAPNETPFGKVYIYDEDLNLIGTIIGDKDHVISSVLVADIVGSETQDIIFGPDNTALNANLQRIKADIISTGIISVIDGDADLTGVTVLTDATSDASLTGGPYKAVTFGDINSDDLTDMAVSTEAGELLIFWDPFGTDSEITDGDASIRVTGADVDSEFGAMVRIGSFTGDEFTDVAIGVPGAGDDSQGAVSVLFGQSEWPALINVNSTANVMQVLGEGPGDAIGHDLLVANTNDDGVDEIYTIKAEQDVFVINLGQSGADTGGGTTGGGSLSGSGCSLHAGPLVPVQQGAFWILMTLLAGLLGASRFRRK